VEAGLRARLVRRSISFMIFAHILPRRRYLATSWKEVVVSGERTRRGANSSTSDPHAVAASRREKKAMAFEKVVKLLDVSRLADGSQE